MSEYAPTPWTVESTNANGWKGLSIRAADGLFVANLVMQPGAENERENARLIVRAVNCHDDLQAACIAALAKLTGDGMDGTLGHHPDNPLPTQLRAAIAKAGASA